MIRREPFGGIIYDDETGKIYTTDKFSFRALELVTQENVGIDDVPERLKIEFPGTSPDVFEMHKFFNLLKSLFSKETLSVRRGVSMIQSETKSVWDLDKVDTHFIAPVIIFWIFTNKCNIRCIHCVQDSGTSLVDELSVDECKKVIDEMFEMGVCELSFSGGEPMTRLDDLIQIGTYANSLGFKLSIATNGLLANKENANRLSVAGFKHAQVSIEGTEKTHNSIRGKGTYNKTLKGINNLLQENFFVMIATTVSGFNKSDLREVVQNAKRLGVQGVRFVRFLPMGRGLKNIDLFAISKEEELRIAEELWRLKWENKKDLIITFNKHYASYGMRVAPEISNLDQFHWKWDCPAGRMRASIMPSGNITTCPLIGSLGLQGGNVRTHSFRKLWEEGAFFEEFRKEKEDCIGCSEWSSCKGGCKAWSYAKYHRLGAKDPLCFRNSPFLV